MNDIDAFRAAIRGITPYRLRYWTRKRIILAIICTALHVAVVVNVWVADQHTPRVFNIQQCAQHTSPRGVTI